MEYSHGSSSGIQDYRPLKFGVCVNFNVQNSAQEWAEESKRLSFIKTSNTATTSICNSSTHLGAGILHHEPSEDYKSSIHSSLHGMRQRMAPSSVANRHASTELANHRVNRAAGAVSALTSVVKEDSKPVKRLNGYEVEAHWPNGSKFCDSLPKISEVKQFDEKDSDNNLTDEHQASPDKTVQPSPAKAPLSQEALDARKALGTVYEKVLVVDDVKSARSVVQLLTSKFFFAGLLLNIEIFDQVSNIDVKQETPVGHGDVICFSIYSGSSGAEADFGNGKTCIWVDVLDGGRDVLMEFAPFFEDPSIRKVWHNYSFDSHIIENYGIKVAGFHADTMHLARLWDSSRRLDGGYSLEGLTNDHRIMGAVSKELKKIGKRSMKTIFEIEKVAVAQRKLAADKFRKWASKYCPDAKYMNVNSDTQIRQLFFGGIENRSRPGETLPKSKAIKVPNDGNVVVEEGKKAFLKFQKILGISRPGETLPKSKAIKVPNDGNVVVEEGKKVPKYRTIELFSIVEGLKADIFTASGWPSVSGDALRSLAGKVPLDLVYATDDGEDDECGSDSETSDYEMEDTSSYGTAYEAFGGGKEGREACHAIAALCEICSIDSLISNFILPLQNQPALEKDRYKIRQAFVAAPGNTLIVADYGQLELRILAHLADCKSMLDAFKAGGDFHSRTAMNMYQHIREAVEEEKVLLEWHAQPGQEKPPVPLLKDAFGAERRKAKMLNFSIAYGKTAHGLARDWKVSVKEAKDTLKLWYSDRKEVLAWQMRQKELAQERCEVYTLLGRSRRFPSMALVTSGQRGHIERAAINAPVQGSAADVAMCAMLEIDRNIRLKELGWTLLLQVHDEVILEGPAESADVAKAIVVECMSKPFYGTNILNVELAVDAKCAQNWYAAK
ncbi:hypothetical protein PR202_gb14207 [Eleusine coracana subsp. coracana]|uniref:DNA-directed DNA polymerase n=1 Tax=Eleusine coracana subsp. coracana TaxID=191504 RepID=A0AAV5EUM0_ELECO|nr:hypothetical protein PR202_gb14207 [Eleusine coracana subsp. coracana]